MQTTITDNYEDLFDFLSKVDQDIADINASLARAEDPATRRFPKIPQLSFASLGFHSDMLFIECADEDYYNELRLRMSSPQSRTYELLGGTYSRVVLRCPEIRDHHRIGLVRTPFRARSPEREKEAMVH